VITEAASTCACIASETLTAGRDSITGSPGRQAPSTLTAGCCQDEESASDDFMEPNNRTDGSQALEWDIEGMSAETDDFQ
jgi:hypothetical protein